MEQIHKYKPFETDSFRDEVIDKLSKMNEILKATGNVANRLGNLKEALELAFPIWFIGWDCWRDERCGFAGIYFRKAMLNLGAALMKEFRDDDKKKEIKQRNPRVFQNGEVDFAVQESLLFAMLSDLYDKLERAGI
ncbi:hypothetical protein Q1695_004320 [Nippostrongylus brasiliensis]|nr:hypothetical protein Q1695_004320 [Nippostrongylus brasiliensis]